MVDYSGYIIGFVSTIIVALLVYSLNVRSTEKEKKEQKIAVHKLIKVEIDQNIKYLEIFLNEIKKESEKNETNLGSSMGSLPPINTGMYNKFALLVPSSFNDSEFEKLYDFYRSIDDLKFKYNKMILILSKDHSVTDIPVDPTRPAVTHPGEMPQSDIILLKEISNEFEEIIINLLNEGNPIKKNRI